LVFLDHFDALILKIIFFLKKYYFNIFLNKKHFEKQSPSKQTHPCLFFFSILREKKLFESSEKKNIKILFVNKYNIFLFLE